MIKCVLISDIHFNLNNLEVASIALRTALHKAEELRVPLLISGDLNDSKAVIRAEVANELIKILSRRITQVYILIGNHDLLHEKSMEHSLNFLSQYATILSGLAYLEDLELFTISYQNNEVELQNYINLIPTNSTVIMHQGFLGAHMGEYVQDKTSISTDKVKHLRVFSGHYHKHQTLGTVTYIGTPYTVSYSEAEDGPKGYLIVNSDNTFEQVPIDNLRRHIIIERNVSNLYHEFTNLNKYDKLWIKVRGTKLELNSVDRSKLAIVSGIPDNFKLDLIAIHEIVEQKSMVELKSTELLDQIIEASDAAKVETFKELWRELLSENTKS